MVGTGVGAQRGILIKNSEALERGKKIDVMVFDKTGTLTQGKPQVTDITPLGKVTLEEVLRNAASIEALSEHPLAQAVVKAALEKKITPQEVKKFKNIVGKGVIGVIGKNIFLVGSKRLMIEEKIDLKEAQKAISKAEEEAKTLLIIAKDHKAIGVIAIADTIKPDAIVAIKKLHKMHITTVMITGDNEKTAQAIARQLGIKMVFAEVLPQDKAEKVKLLQSQKKKVAFVGDGINDAPALVQADLGIAVGTGTDIAIEAGNIVLVKGSPLKAVEALQLSRKTFSTIKQNLFWAFVYNLVGIPLAAGLLYPFTGWLLSPIIAGAAMALSSISVVTNSLLMRKLILRRFARQ